MFDLDVIFGAMKPLVPIAAAAISHWGFGTDATNTAMITGVFGTLSAVWAAYSSTQRAKIASVNAGDNGLSVVSTKAAKEAGIPAATAPLK